MTGHTGPLMYPAKPGMCQMQKKWYLRWFLGYPKTQQLVKNERGRESWKQPVFTGYEHRLFVVFGF